MVEYAILDHTLRNRVKASHRNNSILTNETNKKYRMLLIEDSEGDSQIIELRLQQAGLNFEYERVDSKSDIKRAVESRLWDVIICDYSLPGFNAEEVLDIVKPIDEDIPFIIVSGTVGEKTAVKLMKAGVHDYVMKNNLSRLAPAIQRESKEAEIRRTAKQTQKKLVESERRYRSIVEDQTEFIVRWTPRGTVAFVNDSYCRYFKKSHQEFLDSDFFQFIQNQDLAKFKEKIHALTRDNPVATDEHRVTFPDGQVAWHQWVNRAIFNDEGALIEYQSVGRDITALKHAEDELRKTHAELKELKDRLQKEGPLQNLWFTVLKKLPPSSQTRIRHKPFTAFSIYSDSV